jgi:hypothetical protein
MRPRNPQLVSMQFYIYHGSIMMRPLGFRTPASEAVGGCMLSVSVRLGARSVSLSFFHA